MFKANSGDSVDAPNWSDGNTNENSYCNYAYVM